MKIVIFIKVVFLLMSIYDLSGQKKYWIDSKVPSIQNLVDSLDIEPEYCSEWATACSYVLDNKTYKFLNEKIDLRPVLSFQERKAITEESIFGFALEQIEAQVFVQEGLNGEGVKIGIIDGGFLRADKDASLAHFFEKDLVRYYKDFVTPELDKYGGAYGLDDGHGTEVWQLIGGLNPTKNIQYGLATHSMYYLARTDHGGYERRIEEDYILQAMEEMAKEGVRLFNISLGYTEDYNNASENYKISDVDGKTSMLTRALDNAAVDKGLLFVVAAGNDGTSKWKTLSIPADAKNVLTVGASKFKVWDKISFSSIGPESLPYVKPNVSVYSTLGTSFSTPVVTGLAACIMQYDSTLTNFEIIDLLEKSSNFYPYGNNYLGYGVPTCHNILKLLEGDELVRPDSIVTSKNSIKLKGEFAGKTVVVYHKQDERNVMHRMNYKPGKDKLLITKPKKAKQSTVLIETDIIEIFWAE